MKTRRTMIPEFPRLRDEKAVEAPYGFVNELEEREKQLIDKEILARWLGENRAKESQLKWLRYIFTM